VFDDAKLKVLWAQKMIADLRDGVIRDIKKQRCKIVTEHNPKTKELSLRVLGDFAPVDPGIRLLAGTCAQTLRSSLDYVTSEIVNNARNTDRRVHFPIDTEQAQLERSQSYKKILNFDGALAAHILNEIKPTKADNFPIWAINALANTDKHRNLVLATNVHGFHISELRRNDGIDMRDVIRTFPAGSKNDEELLIPNVEKYCNPKAIIEIRISEPDLARTHSLNQYEIVKTLANFAHVTSETIESIERFRSE
jgi:hypothetical protein